MHLAFIRLMFLTYQASDFNNWEKWEILLYVFIILNGRFSFKLNFILGWNSTRFIPGWNSRINRIFFIPGWDFISVTCKRTFRFEELNNLKNLNLILKNSWFFNTELKIHQQFHDYVFVVLKLNSYYICAWRGVSL